MNFLELCRETIAEQGAGERGSISSIADANEYNRTLTAAVRQAWKHIQNFREDWLWRRREFTAALVPGQEAYKWNRLLQPDGQRSIETFRNWYTPTRGSPSSPEWFIEHPTGAPLQLGTLSYDAMRQRRFTLRNLRTRPTYYAVYPDRSLVFHAPPDMAYTVHGLYESGIQTLRQDTDVPEGLDEEYHEIIVWRAVMILHGKDRQGASFEFCRVNYRELMDSLVRLQTPKPRVARPLA